MARELNRSPKTIYHNWERTRDTFLKKGIVLTRWGRGKNIEYEIEYEEIDED